MAQETMVQGNSSVPTDWTIAFEMFYFTLSRMFWCSDRRIPQLQIHFSAVSVTRDFEPLLVMALSAMKILGFPPFYKSYALETEGYKLFSQIIYIYKFMQLVWNTAKTFNL